MKPENMQKLNIIYGIYFMISASISLLNRNSSMVSIIGYLAVYLNYCVIAELTKNKDEKVRKIERIVKSAFLIAMVVLLALAIYLTIISVRS